ncbi:DNA-binding protein [Cohnella kolymensis]|uniref:DNA-binding protein n=2 Tax=Cohnella kolymensis TaxID=1590652 RepID=A0ABR5A3S6_9BACL|nr:DNA-binding protein [Cohnella kolymensis]
MATLYIKVQDLLDERGWTQKHLAIMTGLRTAAVSEICNNMRTSINKEHLEKIAEAFGLKDINELMELR